MLTRIRHFFYNYRDVLAFFWAFFGYLNLLLIAGAPEFVLEILTFFVVVSAISVAALVTAIVLYDIVFRLTLGIAALLDWVFPLNAEVEDKASVLEALITSQILYEPYDDVIIASDLRPYTSNELHGFEGHLSPYTREGLHEVAPFPYHFAKHTAFSQNPNFTNLIALCTCPVTNNIMTNPMVADLIYTNEQFAETPFVLVCDELALENLPPHIRLATDADGRPHQLHYEQLETVLQDERILSDLNRQANWEPRADIALGWESAFQEATTDAQPVSPRLQEPSMIPNDRSIPKHQFTYTDTIYGLFGERQPSIHHHVTNVNDYDGARP